MQVTMALIDDEADRSQMVTEIQRGWATDPGLLEERWPRITPWLDMVESVTADGDERTAEVVVFGQVEQASLQAAVSGGVGA
jgi:hypothetical protein